MNRISFSLSLIAVAALAACETFDRATPAPGAVVVEPAKSPTSSGPATTIVAPVVVAPAPAAAPAPAPAPVATLRPGNGRVESINASTGTSQRIGLRMDDGSVQFVSSSNAPNLAIGDRIELTADGQARRPGSSSVTMVTPTTDPSTVVVPSAATLRPGSGRIESIAAVPSSAAGGGKSTKRVGVRMTDGSVQFVDTEAVGLALGDRIDLTSDGLLRRPVP